MTEAEWLACDQPQMLYRFARGRLGPQRFRWLAADWSARIRHILDTDDRSWADAFAAWVAGTGRPPADTCPSPGYYPLDRPTSEVLWARRFAEALRRDDPMGAAVAAGLSASENLPFVASETTDFALDHRSRAKAKRASEKAQTDAHRDAWRAAKDAHAVRVRREFCEQFRDVCGNLPRPATVDPAWLTPTVLAITRGIEADRAWDRLPVLADALSDAGCQEAQVLDHCRGGTHHVPGCWVIDLLTCDEHGRPTQVLENQPI